MKYRKLGSSDLEVSCLSLGCWQLADAAYWGEAGGDPSDAVHAAMDAGINLFDNVETYGAGESERALAKALDGERDRVLIATKVSADHCEPRALREACEGSLQRLRTDRIDLYQVHWPCREVPFADTFAELNTLKREGKIRVIGLSNFGRQDLDDWMKTGSADANQLGYNILFRAIETDIVPACAQYGLGILVYMPLLQGILSGRWRTIEDIPESRRRTRHFSCEREGVRHGEPGHEALLTDTLAKLGAVAERVGQPLADLVLAWTIARPQVASVIVGGRRPEQVCRNLAAADFEPGNELIAELDAISEPLRQAMGPNADFWLGGGKSRIR